MNKWKQKPHTTLSMIRPTKAHINIYYALTVCKESKIQAAKTTLQTLIKNINWTNGNKERQTF